VTPAHRRSRAGLVTGLLLVVLVIAGAGAHRAVLFWVRRDHLVGIDVSHHQGHVDWGKAQAAGAAFAFIKATEGATFTDPRFAASWSEARASGVLRGAYHFFTFCTPGREQAAHFVEVVPVEDEALPPLVDLEYEGNCQRRPSLDDLKAQLDDFLRIVEPRHRRQVTFYVTEEAYADYGSLTEGHALFVREMGARPRWLGDRRWLFWQFDDAGRLDGIEGPVDLDAFRGTADELRALTRREAAGTSAVDARRDP
jgi:lysozyme